MASNNDSGKRKITAKLNCLKKNQTFCDVCLLCQQPANEFNDVHCGHLYKLRKFALHYLCVLTASSLAQRTDLEKEFFGFCYVDIIEIYKKSLKNVCERCKTVGATIKCVVCDKHYHLPCSIRSGMVINMQGCYAAYCYSCKSPKPIASTLFQDKSCIICFDKVESDDKALRPNCCQAEELFHVYCLKKLAMSSGCQFKCPLCLNIGKFRKTARSHGVFIPNHPPVWIEDSIISPQPVNRELLKVFTKELSGSLNPTSAYSSSNQLSPCSSSSASSSTSRHTQNVSAGRSNDRDHSELPHPVPSTSYLDVSSDLNENPNITTEELQAMADQIRAKYPPGFATIFVGERMLCVRYRGEPQAFETAQDNA